jgi:formyltetrahydrofolate deformylase
MEYNTLKLMLMTQVQQHKNSAILQISAVDQKGLVAAVTQFIAVHDGNIIDLEQHVDDVDQEFFMRVEWSLSDFKLSIPELESIFEKQIGLPFKMNWSIEYSETLPRMAIFVSKMSHCLLDILARYQSGELKVNIPVIVSNHLELESIARNLDIEFIHLSINKENKQAQEEKQLAILKEKNIDFVVLARYMQILSKDFIESFPDKIINIHHSFLPAFPGAKPYHSAHTRGVKLIGATSHYVTAELDAGPIIAQDVVRVTHTDSIQDLVRKGRDLEKIVLARAIWAHVNHKILVWENRTIVFR